MKIDFVVPWVDGSDSVWVMQRNSYLPDGMKITEAQYRDWDIFKYWFRCVEVNAPWVNKIHLVTCGQIPEWLNTDHPKLNLVFHRDYMPEEYIPTFSANPIELNLHRIEALSECFVYFNDDVFLNSKVEPEDFFKNGIPCESPILSTLVSSVVDDKFVHILCNDMAVINQRFQKKKVIKKALFKWYSPKYGKLILKNILYLWGSGFSAFQNFHIAASMRKSTYREVWEKEHAILDRTSRNKFRSLNDVNQYLFSYYNICKGEFTPRRTDFGKFYIIGTYSETLYADILNKRHKVICINDTLNGIDADTERKKLISIFEQAYPEKSSFER